MSTPDKLPNDWRDALDGHESPLDTDRFWSGLEPRLPKKRRRRGFLWWWVGAGGAAALLLALWVDAPEKGSVGTEAMPSPAGNGKYRSEAQEIIGEAPPVADPVTGEQPDRGFEVRQEAEPSMTGASPTAEAGRTPGSAPRGALKPAVPPKVARTDAPVSGSRPAVSARSEAPRIAIPPVTEEAPTENANTEATHPEATRTETAIPAPVVQAPSPAAQAAEATVDVPPTAGAELEPEKKKKRRKPALTLDLLGGPGMAFRSLGEAKGVSEGYLAQRKATESPLESWTAGADLRWTAPKGLFVLGGFRWQRVQERFDWQRFERRSEYGLADGFLMTAGGGMVPWQDSAWITWEESRTVRHYNKVDMIEIPIALGYRFPVGMLQADMALGALLNIRQRAEGRSLGTGGLPAAWSSVDALRWRRSAGLGLLAQARLGWAPDNRHAFFIQPTFQWSPVNRMDAAAGYRARYAQAYLQVGMSLRLR